MSQPGYSPNNDYLVIPIDLNEAFKKEAYQSYKRQGRLSIFKR
jgi:hypothetical protein